MSCYDHALTFGVHPKRFDPSTGSRLIMKFSTDWSGFFEHRTEKGTSIVGLSGSIRNLLTNSILYGQTMVKTQKAH